MTAFESIWKAFIEGGEKVLIMNHYELAEHLEHKYSIEDCKAFLLNPKVQEYIKQEFSIISESNMRKIISGVGEQDNSVGKAQLINAMLSATEKTSGKREGNIIIYSYILPNENQAKATNTQIIKRDPFKKPWINDSRY